MVKDLPATQGIQIWSLGWEDSLEKEMVSHSSIFAWRIPWTGEPLGLQSVRLQRVRHDWATKHDCLLGATHCIKSTELSAALFSLRHKVLMRSYEVEISLFILQLGKLMRERWIICWRPLRSTGIEVVPCLFSLLPETTNTLNSLVMELQQEACCGAGYFAERGFERANTYLELALWKRGHCWEDSVGGGRLRRDTQGWADSFRGK